MIASQKQKIGAGERIGTADFLYHWIGGTFLTWVMTGFLAGAQIVALMILLYMAGMNGRGQTALIIVVSLTGGATAGYFIGRLQYYLMSRRGRPLYEWVPASIIGGVFGMPATLITIALLQSSGANPFFYTLLPLPIFMGVLSALQMLVLRRYTRFAPLWVMASMGGGVVYALLQIVWPLAVLAQGAVMGAAIHWLMQRMTETPNYTERRVPQTQAV